VLDGRIRSVKDAAGLKLAQGELTELLSAPCFAMSAEAPRSHDSASVVAFTSWWRDGGHAWVRSYLEADAQQHLAFVTLAPDVRESLSPGDADFKKPLPPALGELLCPAHALHCGAEARAFRRRAERSFEMGRGTLYQDCARPDPGGEATAARRCDRLARTAGYVGWRDCIEGLRPRRPALPWGDLRSPSAGWLEIDRGEQVARAGQRCAQTHVFHVESGSAFVVESCAGKAGPASSSGHDTVIAGRVPGGLLRESLWMLLLADRVTLLQTSEHSVQVPKGLATRWPVGRVERPLSGCAMGPSAHAPVISWRWSGASTVADRFRTDGSPGSAYAALLVDVLIASFDDLPPSQPLPSALRDRIRQKPFAPAP
jgi:hypothetical protein